MIFNPIFLRSIFNEIKFLNCVFLGASFKNILGFLMNFWGPIVTFYFLENPGFIRIFFRLILRIFFYIFQSSHFFFINFLCSYSEFGFLYPQPLDREGIYYLKTCLLEIKVLYPRSFWSKSV